MKLLNAVANKSANAAARDGLEDLIQGILLGYEGLIPDRRSTLLIDDFENPSIVPLDPVDQDFQGCAILTPRERYVLPGVSRQTIIELAQELGISFEEADVDLFGAANADEIFMTGSSFYLCPVHTLNGSKVGKGALPGPITTRLTMAYADLVGMDFVAQILNAA